MMQKEQRLYWAISRPLRWLGLTIDEWVVLLAGVIPGLFILNDDQSSIGIMMIVGGFMLCYFVKKFKKISEFFLIKSWLLSRGYISKPSKNYPQMLGKRIYK